MRGPSANLPILVLDAGPDLLKSFKLIKDYLRPIRPLVHFAIGRALPRQSQRMAEPEKLLRRIGHPTVTLFTSGPSQFSENLAKYTAIAEQVGTGVEHYIRIFTCSRDCSAPDPISRDRHERIDAKGVQLALGGQRSGDCESEGGYGQAEVKNQPVLHARGRRTHGHGRRFNCP